MQEGTEYTLERQFQAPIEQVWRMWTDAKLLSEWYGPNVETVVHEFNAEPGGRWLNEWKMGDSSQYQRIDFVGVDAPSSLVYLMNSSNNDWEVVAMTMMPNWPKTVKTHVNLSEHDGGTKLSMVQYPVDCTEEEDAMFQQSIPHMDGGWAKGFEIIDGLLAK